MTYRVDLSGIAIRLKSIDHSETVGELVIELTIDGVSQDLPYGAAKAIHDAICAGLAVMESLSDAFPAKDPNERNPAKKTKPPPRSAPHLN